jgi:hypothetical protein
MTTEFAKPRFTGPRFEEHTLPVEVTVDLAAYKDLIVELAKHLYLADHPERKRVPKRFEESFALHLAQVEGGSARPVLAVVVAAGLALQGGAADYFHQARDLVGDCVAAKAEQASLPARFPKELLAYFNVFGRSLRDGEALELPGTAGGVAELTPARRKALVLDVQRVYSRDVEASGVVAEIDFDGKTFELRREDGTTVLVTMPEIFTEDVRRAGGRDRMQVQVAGVGVFDAYDRLQKLAETQHIEVFPNQMLVTQVEALTLLQDGWCAGEGIAPDKEQLEWAAGKLAETFPEILPFPLVAPTPEGGLFLEWIAGAWRVSCEVLLPEHSAEMQAVNTESGEVHDKTVNLGDAAGWTPLYDFARRFV